MSNVNCLKCQLSGHTEDCLATVTLKTKQARHDETIDYCLEGDTENADYESADLEEHSADLWIDWVGGEAKVGIGSVNDGNKVLAKAKSSDNCKVSSIWVKYAREKEQDEEVEATAVWEFHTTSYGEYTPDT